MVITKSKSNHFSLIAFICTLMIAISVMLSSVVVNAKEEYSGSSVSTATFSGKVKDFITTDAGYKDREYTTSGGGFFKPGDLLTLSSDNIVVVNLSTYNQLTSSAKTNFLTDLNAVAEEVVKLDTDKKGLTDESISNWYAILQQQDGVGSKMLNMILANTKPDFVAANNIYKPFSGLVGIALGLGSVLILAFLTVVMICDISYITLPPVRLFAGESGEGGGKSGGIKSKLFSHDAIYAVDQAENSNGNGTPKQALGIYFKRRVFMLILLGICLLYLIQGQIFGLVGMILDLVSGFM